MKKRIILGALAALVGTAIFGKVVKEVHNALRVQLENCTEETVHCWIGTEAAPDAIVLMDIQPGESRQVDLTNLPLGPHASIYIRFAGFEGRDGFKRTLIYDVDEYQGLVRALIVDYGQGTTDVKLVRT